MERPILSALVLLVGCPEVAVISNNVAPTVNIESPDEGGSASLGSVVTLQGVVADEATPLDQLMVSWASSRDGDLFSGNPDTDGRTVYEIDSLSLGLHILTLEVRDTQAAVSRDSVTIDMREEVPTNGPPTAPVPIVVPAEPLPADDLVCSLGAPSTDPDGDTVLYSFEFARDGETLYEAVGDAATELTAPSAATNTGDTWRCTVIANDGSKDGDPGWDEVTVVCPSASGGDADCPGVTCLGILQAGHSIGDGTYWITAGTTGEFQVPCDMTTDGGGWTGLDFPTVDARLSGALQAVDPTGIEGIDPVLGPYTQDGAGDHAYQYDFDWGPGYDAYYLGTDYLIASNACAGDGCECNGPTCTADVSGDCWTQTTWTQGYSSAGCGSFGDVSHGSPGDAGPASTLSSQFGPVTVFDPLDTIPWPDGTTAYFVEAAASATAFRVAWGDTGAQFEGWYPWYAGTIFVR